MKREVDKRKTAKALRKLRRVAERANEEGGPGLTTWEKDFVEGVTTRLETYGSAFRDPGKGRLEEALSARQQQVTRVIDKKSRQSKAEKAQADWAKSADPKTSAGGAGKDTARPHAQKPRSSFKPKAKPGWKPRGRDINDDTDPDPDPAQTLKRPALKVIPGGRRAQATD